MESRGIVVRRANPDDRRSALVQLTAYGRRRWQETLPAFADALRRAERRIAMPHDKVAASLDAIAQPRRGARSPALVAMRSRARRGTRPGRGRNRSSSRPRALVRRHARARSLGLPDARALHEVVHGQRQHDRTRAELIGVDTELWVSSSSGTSCPGTTEEVVDRLLPDGSSRRFSSPRACRTQRTARSARGNTCGSAALRTRAKVVVQVTRTFCPTTSAGRSAGFRRGSPRRARPPGVFRPAISASSSTGRAQVEPAVGRDPVLDPANRPRFGRSA